MKTQMNISIDEALLDEFRVEAKRLNMKMSNLVEDKIEELVEQMKKSERF